jgi:oligoendopeptidase F
MFRGWCFATRRFASTDAWTAPRGKLKGVTSPGRERFVAVPKSGGSDYPFELYKKTELDMATSAPYQALMDGLDRRLAEE